MLVDLGDVRIHYEEAGLNNPRAIVFCHGLGSNGDGLARSTSGRYPEKCEALILDSTSSEVNVAAAEGWHARAEAARTNPNIKPEHLDSYVAESRGTASLREQPLTPRLKSITCPVLVVGGGKDTVAGAGGSVVLSRTLANARLQIFNDAGHGIIAQDAEGFRALVLEWAKDNGLV